VKITDKKVIGGIVVLTVLLGSGAYLQFKKRGVR